MFFLFLFFFFPFKYQFISQFFLNSIYLCNPFIHSLEFVLLFLTATFYMYHQSFASVVDFEIPLSSIFLEDDCLFNFLKKYKLITFVILRFP